MVSPPELALMRQLFERARDAARKLRVSMMRREISRRYEFEALVDWFYEDPEGGAVRTKEACALREHLFAPTAAEVTAALERGDFTVCASALPHDDPPPLRDELEALIKRWSALAHQRAHNYEGADYQLGSAAGMRQCIDDLVRLLGSDKST
jgi:hypothetical protein